MSHCRLVGELFSLVTIGRHRKTKRLRLAKVQSWIPPRGGKLDLDTIKTAVLETHRTYHSKIFGDPYQCELLAQQLVKEGVQIELVAFSGKALPEMASGILEAFTSREIDIYPHDALFHDLRRIRIKESPAGWKLDAPRTSAGHCDRAVALALAILAAKRTPIAGTFWVGFADEFGQDKPADDPLLGDGWITVKEERY